MFLRFVYLLSVNSLKLNDYNLLFSHQVLAAASHLQVQDAIEACCRFLELALTVENCIDILHMCELYSLDNSLKHCRHFILKNFELLADTGQYTQLLNVPVKHSTSLRHF